VRIRERAISWMDVPGWIGFMRLRSWLRDRPGHGPARSKQGAQVGADGKSVVFACSRRARCRRPDTGGRAGRGAGPPAGRNYQLPTANRQDTSNYQLPT